MEDFLLEKEFYDAVMEDIKILMTKGYKPTIFLEMISNYGAIESAKKLINSQKPSEGYTKLWRIGELQHSVENRIQDKKWESLFSDEDRKKARKRLQEYGFIVK